MSAPATAQQQECLDQQQAGWVGCSCWVPGGVPARRAGSSRQCATLARTRPTPSSFLQIWPRCRLLDVLRGAEPRCASLWTGWAVLDEARRLACWLGLFRSRPLTSHCSARRSRLAASAFLVGHNGSGCALGASRRWHWLLVGGAPCLRVVVRQEGVRSAVVACGAGCLGAAPGTAVFKPLRKRIN